MRSIGKSTAKFKTAAQLHSSQNSQNQIETGKNFLHRDLVSFKNGA